MSDKTLGQVAHEAQQRSLGATNDGWILGQWQFGLNKHGRDAWQAAAEAVAAKIGNRELQAKSLEELDAECAVIEAAKLSDKLADAIECGEDVTDVQLQDAVGQLRQAVRALAELEEQDPVPLDKVKTWEGE